MAIITKEVCFVAIERTASMRRTYKKRTEYIVDEIVRVFDDRAAAEKFARSSEKTIIIKEVEKGR